MATTMVNGPLVSPEWGILRDGHGKHLIFGINPLNASDWETVDRPFDLLHDEWPWKDVSRIHCISMLYQWDMEDSIGLIKNAYAALRTGGILWLGESFRDADPKEGRLSCYTPNMLGRIAERCGFKVQQVKDQAIVTGRPDDYAGQLPRAFALKCEKVI